MSRLYTNPERATRQVLRHRRETPPAPRPDAVIEVGRMFAEFREALGRIDLSAGRGRCTCRRCQRRAVR